MLYFNLYDEKAKVIKCWSQFRGQGSFGGYKLLKSWGKTIWNILNVKIEKSHIRQFHFWVYMEKHEINIFMAH